MNGKALEERLWRFVPASLRPPAQLTARALTRWVSEGGPLYGAAIAFYTMFALAPLLVLAIWVTGAVFGAEAARGQIVGRIESLVGSTAAQSIQSMIESAWREPVGNFAGLLALLTLLVGASGVFAQLQRALNAMARVRPSESPLGGFLRTRLVAFALVLGFGLLAMTLLLASTAVAALGAWLSSRVPVAGLPALLALADVGLSTAAIAVGFAALMRWLPERPASRHAVWVGAIVGALLFSVGKHLIGLYLARASVASSYGAAGSFVVAMMWMYYSAQILLFGASLGHALDERQGLAPGGAPRQAGVPAGPGAAPGSPASAGREPEMGPEQQQRGRSGPSSSQQPQQLPQPPGGAASGTSGGGAKILPFTPAARSRSDLRRPGGGG
ncbi:YihY/virulence factor BrkB family protein [Caldimonas tepidiphila]|uniref:YihY/virulence factor BrkB family protein n=1 Tax=Caldimonas tepidiphila TaxID=2315841 RepID=UPI000E5A7885|nr:YihY/virulence factor BrkB family protein [Caldimonas tepidiphila]